MYKMVQIWPGLFVCKQVIVCPGHIWTTLYLFTAFMAEYQRVYHFQQNACLYSFGYLNHCEGSCLQTYAANQNFLRRRVVLRSIVCSLVSFLHTWPPSSVPMTLLKAEAISTPVMLLFSAGGQPDRRWFTALWQMFTRSQADCLYIWYILCKSYFLSQVLFTFNREHPYGFLHPTK
jgi:hypothetical protein